MILLELGLFDWLDKNPDYNWIVAVFTLLGVLLVIVLIILIIQIIRNLNLKSISVAGIKASFKHGTKSVKSDRPRILFLSTPVKGLSLKSRKELFENMSNICSELEKMPGIKEVIYTSRYQRTIEEFNRHYKDSSAYYPLIDKSDGFIVVVPKNFKVEGYVSGVFYESGYAMARGKDSQYFLPDDGDFDLPDRMKTAGAVPGINITVQRYSSYDQIKNDIANKFA